MTCGQTYTWRGEISLGPCFRNLYTAETTSLILKWPTDADGVQLILLIKQYVLT